jgi:hypothetical protein
LHRKQINLALYFALKLELLAFKAKNAMTDISTKQADNAVQKAVEKMGSQKALAKVCTPEVSRQAVAFWIKLGYVPAKHVPAVNLATGIPRSELNPLFK